MKMYFKGFLIFVGIHLMLFLAACSDDVECGGFDSKFGILGFSITESKFEDESNLFNAIPITDADTVTYDSLYLNMNASIQTFSQNTKGSFFSAAYACSPITPEPVDTVTNIQVFSVEQTSVTTFDIVEDLTDQFDIISFTEVGGFSDRMTLTEFNSRERLAGSSYFLFPTWQPDSITSIGFKTIVNFTDNDSFEASSKIISIAP